MFFCVMYNYALSYFNLNFIIKYNETYCNHKQIFLIYEKKHITNIKDIIIIIIIRNIHYLFCNNKKYTNFLTLK